MLAPALNTVCESVKEFHRKFHHPTPAVPVCFGADSQSVRMSHILDSLSETYKHSAQSRKVLRAAWILEELAEYLAADDLVGEVDALCDLEYFLQGTLVEQGIEPGPCFAIVHEKNMMKLPSIAGEKVTKPEGWEGPERELAEELRQQGANL